MGEDLQIRDRSVCLCMIVCNEERVIERSLASVLRFIDHWVICDTGSTDATIDRVGSILANIPGTLHQVNWRDFAYNRQQVLELAADSADYCLVLDADMTVNVRAPFKHLLMEDFYYIRYEGPIDYQEKRLVSAAQRWLYSGTTHELIRSASPTSGCTLSQITFDHYCDGGMRREKFERDRHLLNEALNRDAKDPRTLFYLAQTHFDLANYLEALRWYRLRAELDGWVEESWYASYRIACCLHKTGVPWESVYVAYQRAYVLRPTRLEPLYEIVKQFRRLRQYRQGYESGLPGMASPYPLDRLFVDRAIYEYRFNFEFGLCAYAVGDHRNASISFRKVLASGAPEWMRRTIISLDLESMVI